MCTKTKPNVNIKHNWDQKVQKSNKNELSQKSECQRSAFIWMNNIYIINWKVSSDLRV